MAKQAEMVRKECGLCGKEFWTRQARKKYCCEEHARIAHYGPGPDRTPRQCLVCQREFVPYRSTQVYCSEEHRAKNYNLIHDIAGQLRKKRQERRILAGGSE